MPSPLTVFGALNLNARNFDVESVSYTHLDVYKRQPQCEGQADPCTSGRTGGLAEGGQAV